MLKHGPNLSILVGFDKPLMLDVGSCFFHLYPKNKNGIVKVYVAIFFAIRYCIVLMKNIVHYSLLIVH
jgi:hypothetical protein